LVLLAITDETQEIAPIMLLLLVLPAIGSGHDRQPQQVKGCRALLCHGHAAAI
jgi:hypothetical protein